jgi:hypothetical protein
MDAMPDLIVTTAETLLVLAGALVAVAIGGVLLVLLSLLATRPVRPRGLDPADRDPHRDDDPLRHIHIPGHSTNPVAVPKTVRRPGEAVGR